LDQRIIEGQNVHGDTDSESDVEFNAARDEDASTLHYKDLTFGKEVSRSANLKWLSFTSSWFKRM
jgi:hypothetical protein